MSDQVVIIKVLGYELEQINEKIKKAKCYDGIKVNASEKYLDGRIEVICECDDDIAFYQTIEGIKNQFNEQDIYAEGDILPEECLVALLTDKGKIMAAAESVTGGLISSKIISVSGASAVFYEGIVAYDCNAKVRRLHVPSSLIEEFGAVSEEVCRAMTFGLLSLKNADYVVATTGCAGPNSDEFKTPIGLVYLGCSDQSRKIKITKANFKGDRNTIRECAANIALHKLIKLIKNEE